MMGDKILVATLARYGVNLLKTKPRPYLWHYKRAEKFFLTKSWQVEFTDSVAAYEAVMEKVCPLRVDFSHIPYLGDVVPFVKEQCRGQVGFVYFVTQLGPSTATSSAWFSELHDATLYKLTFS
jgi:hypothetical protein